MLPVAPGGTGLPPSSPNADSNESTPCSSAARTLARPWPRVLWKWAVSSTPASRSPRRGEELAPPGADSPSPWCRRTRPPRSRPPPSRSAISNTRAGGTSPSYGQPKETEITPSQRSPSPRARATVRSQPLERLGDRPVDVLAVVALRCGQEHVDLVEAVAVRERALQPLLVRDQHRVGDAGGRSIASSTSLGVGELRDHVGTHERRHLEPVQPASPRACPISRTLSAVGITSGSFWNPSRGPTSRMRTRCRELGHGDGPSSGLAPRRCRSPAARGCRPRSCARPP